MAYWPAPDRPGLLATLGALFAELDINVRGARITTLGERVEDVFEITNRDKRAITHSGHAQTIAEAIRARLDAEVAEAGRRLEQPDVATGRKFAKQLERTRRVRHARKVRRARRARRCHEYVFGTRAPPDDCAGEPKPLAVRRVRQRTAWIGGSRC